MPKMTSAEFMEALAKSTDAHKEIVKQVAPFIESDVSEVPPEILQNVIRILLHNLEGQHQMSMKMAIKFLEESEKHNKLKRFFRNIKSQDL